MTSVYDFSATAIDGAETALEQYRGQALLIVNTASKCGFTGQYAGLEALHRQKAFPLMSTHLSRKLESQRPHLRRHLPSLILQLLAYEPPT